MRPQRPGNALRKTVQLRSTKGKGKGRKHTCSGSEVSSARPRTTGDRNQGKRHPRPPNSSPRTNSQLRSAGPAEAGFPPGRGAQLLWRGVRRLRNARCVIGNRTTSFCPGVASLPPVSGSQGLDPSAPPLTARAGRTRPKEHFRWTRALPAAWDQ